MMMMMVMWMWMWMWMMMMAMIRLCSRCINFRNGEEVLWYENCM